MGVRVAALVFPLLLLAGAGPATRPVQYVVQCRVSDASHKSDLSFVICDYEGQECAYFAGGETPVVGGRYVEYGTRLTAIVSAMPDGVMALDISVGRSRIASTKPDVTVCGSTARSVRTIALGQPQRLELSDGTGTVFEVTVDRK